MDFEKIVALEDQVESIFDSSVKSATTGPRTGFPPYVFNINMDKKDLTSSDLEGYEIFGRSFYFHMPVSRTSAGPSAGKTIKGGVVVVYVDARDLLEVEYTTMFVKGRLFDLAVIDPHNVNDTKSTRKGFVYKECSFVTHPMPFTDNCKAIVCEYEGVQAQSGLIDEETGDPKGNTDVIENFSFSEGGVTK